MSEQPLDVFFIRHTDDMDVDDRTREVLWKNHLVGIHFPFDKDDRTRDSERTSPEYYTDKRARKALFSLNRLANSGGFVFSTHYPHSDQFLLGFVEPSSQINITNGTWGNRNGLAGRVARLKTLRLTKVRIIRESRSKETVLLSSVDRCNTTAADFRRYRGNTATAIANR